MVSRFSLSVELLFLVYLALCGTLVSASTSITNNSSQAASPSYPNTTTSTFVANSSSQADSPSYLNTTISSYPNITSLDGVAGASTSTIDYVSGGGASTATIEYVSGSAAIESCVLEWLSWDSSQLEMMPGYNATQTLITLSFETVTSTFYSTYTLCDGIPRIVLDGPLNFSTATSTLDFYTPEVVYTYESLIWPSPVVASTAVTTIPVVVVEASTSEINGNCIYTEYHSTPVYECETGGGYTSAWTPEPPFPACNIDPSDCASLSAASSDAMFTGGGINITASPSLIACETAFNDWMWGPESYPCAIEIPVVQLIYWPVTLASQDLCVYPDPIDITAIQSNTPVASMFGMNITSDENCYLSYPVAIAAFLNLSVETAPGGIVAVPSSNLKSFRNSQYGYSNFFTYSFNFADLPPNPVPVLAYEAGPDCYTSASVGAQDEFIDQSWCETIYDALYTPQLSFPTELIEKFPQWASCDFNFVGLFDPPTTLVPVDFLTPTPSSAASPTIGASPGWTGDPITPSATPVAVTQAPSPTIAIDSHLASGGDHGPGLGSNGDLSIDPDPATNTEPPLGTVVTFGKSGESVAISVSNVDGVAVVDSATLLPGKVTIIDGQTVSALSQGLGVVVDGQTVSVLSQGTGVVVAYDGSADPSAPATAVLTLGDGNAVTATSIAAGAYGFIIVGSQTLTAGQALTTDGVVLSVVDGGLLLSSQAFGSDGGLLLPSEAFESAVAILTVHSETLTALESVNSHGSTIIDVEGIGEIAVGGPAITLSSGVVLSAGDSGLVITGAGGGVATVLYSTKTMVTATPPQSSTSSRLMTAIVTSTSKTGGSSRAGIGMRVLVVWLFAVLGLF